MHTLRPELERYRKSTKSTSYKYKNLIAVVREYIQEYIQESIQESHPDELLLLMYRRSFLRTDLQRIIQNGWRLELKDLRDGRTGESDISKQIIRFSPKLTGIQRDITLAHELVHAHYGEASIDTWLNAAYKGATVELFARNMVADPQWIAEILRVFDLSPQSYDSRKYQHLLPSAQATMDGSLTLRALLQAAP